MSRLMTQEDFGKKIGFHRRTVAQVENGNQKPSLNFIESIQYAFNLSDRKVKELMELEDGTQSDSESD